MLSKQGNGKVLLFRPSRTLYNADTERKKNIVGLRIAEARHSAGMSLKDFSTHLEQYGIYVSAGGINKWEIGNCSPNAYQLLALCFALNISDPLELFSESYHAPLNEIGMRKVKEYISDLIATGLYQNDDIPSDGIQDVYVDMPVSDLRVSAGTGIVLDEGSFENIRVLESSVPSRAQFGVRVSGNSMEPKFHDGQIVWVEPCSELNDHEVGVFIYDGEGYIKAYENRLPDPQEANQFADSYGVQHLQPVLISFNPAYEPIIISPNAEFRIIGRVATVE